MTEKPDERCGTCRYWTGVDADESGEEEGLCRRFPPALNHAFVFFSSIVGKQVPHMAAQSAAAFANAWERPMTTETTYCGEWKKGDAT